MIPLVLPLSVGAARIGYQVLMVSKSGYVHDALYKGTNQLAGACSPTTDLLRTPLMFYSQMARRAENSME